MRRTVIVHPGKNERKLRKVSFNKQAVAVLSTGGEILPKTFRDIKCRLILTKRQM